MLVAGEYAVIGGICAAMSFLISMWMENKILVVILPYIFFQTVADMAYLWKFPQGIKELFTVHVETAFRDTPVSLHFSLFAKWMLILGILFFVSYVVKIRRKR